MKLTLRTLRCAHHNAPKTREAIYPHEWNPARKTMLIYIADSIAFLNLKSAKTYRQASSISWMPYKVKRL